ncbi:MAG: RNA methyltransferase [Bacilli bacterium]|nr:RNA methyltransferase [Bacilli bacterium]
MLYTSIENKKIKEIKKLNIKKYRDQSGLFLIEGQHLIEEAKKASLLQTLILEKEEKNNNDIETMYVTKEIIKYISELDNPSNILGICKKIKENEILGDKILILDEIQDPGNLGTIIRSAVAFNIDTIILGENTVDLYNSKTIRSSQGMLFHINIIRRNIKNIINQLKQENYIILGTKVTNGKNIKTIEKTKKFAIIMGNEGNGVSNDILNNCDDYLYIKMNKTCESLNVAVATSIILYELDK